jgi:hypothetical protein
MSEVFILIQEKEKHKKNKYGREGNSEGRRKHREREDTDFAQC